MAKQILHTRISSVDFLKEIKQGVRRNMISKVVKACLRIYLEDLSFKTRVDEYIKIYKQKVK